MSHFQFQVNLKLAYVTSSPHINKLLLSFFLHFTTNFLLHDLMLTECDCKQGMRIYTLNIPHRRLISLLTSSSKQQIDNMENEALPLSVRR